MKWLIDERCEQRLNVALTRAKYALWIVGHRETLRSDREWAELLRHCDSHRAIFPAAAKAPEPPRYRPRPGSLTVPSPQELMARPPQLLVPPDFHSRHHP